MNKQTYTVTAEDAKTRIDKLLAALEPEQSRSRLQSWIEDGHARVNGNQVKTNYKVQDGDELSWSEPEAIPLEMEKENIPLDILYEDADVLVVNKPRGMVVHPSAGHRSGTLVNALLYHCDDLSGINGVERPGIVHRIDKDTSGLLVVAKNDRAHTSLAAQLSEKTIERKYEAIVHGVIEHETGLVDAPIARDPKDRQRMGIVQGGKAAVTHFQVLKRFDNFTHVECRLETGRTHQIRVHMRYIGYPIVGDPKYGPRKTPQIGGQALHARDLGFAHPVTGEFMRFTVPAPAYFQELLTQLDKLS